MAYDLKYGLIEVGHDSERHPLNNGTEPVFILRAQDDKALETLKFYGALQFASGDKDVSENVMSVIEEFVNWQAVNPDRVKAAD